ncbi:hypothetical protein [Bdellovibrio sp. HCB274]|uniref:hypothetical protein n=1 Tax=Bdellovibrio sp. HCB274 TaxID=3394361 RepID=UPI0039B6119E
MKKLSLKESNLIVGRLQYYTYIYKNKSFVALVNSFASFKTWNEVQQVLSKMKDNSHRGRSYEEIARAIIMTHPFFKGQYKNVYFGRFPHNVQSKLNITNKDFGTDAVAETHTGEYHSFQIKHKTDETKVLGWSTDKLGSFKGDADLADHLVVFSNSAGPCEYFKKKTGKNHTAYNKEIHHQLSHEDIKNISNYLNDRLSRHLKLTNYEQKILGEIELKNCLVGLFRNLRDCYPERKFDLPDKSEFEDLYTINGKSVRAPIYPDNHMTLNIGWFFETNLEIDREWLFDQLSNNKFSDAGLDDMYEYNQDRADGAVHFTFYFEDDSSFSLHALVILECTDDPNKVKRQTTKLLKEVNSIEKRMFKLLSKIDKKYGLL